MTSSQLIAYLEQKGAVVRLKKEIAPYINEFVRGLEIGGGSAPVYLTMENKEVFVGAGHVRNLCKAYLDGIFNASEIEYLASAMDICPDFQFETSELRESIRYLSELHYRDIEPSKVSELVKSIYEDSE
jgi:hypothetical protein